MNCKSGRGQLGGHLPASGGGGMGGDEGSGGQVRKKGMREEEQQVLKGGRGWLKYKTCWER